MKNTETIQKIKAAIRSGDYSAAMDVLIAASPEPTYKVRSAVDLADLLRPWALKKQEYFLMIALDGAHHPIGKPVVITIGLLNRTLVHPREIYRPAIVSGAAAIIIAHNHPSGSVDPSQEDLDVTQRIKQCSDVIGIPLLDHVIFGRDKLYSMADSGNC